MIFDEHLNMFEQHIIGHKRLTDKIVLRELHLPVSKH
jgi:hypothetical protein